MDIFTALADPTRRSIIELLTAHGQLSASEITTHYNISPPAVSQHLKILREANLVIVEKRAQQRIYRVNPQSIQALEAWVTQITQRWNERFDALEQVLQAEKQKALQGERNPTMFNSVPIETSITRLFDAPRELVFKAWTDPILLQQWWGPKVFTNPVCEVDARPGGALLIHMQAPDGTIYPEKGIFHEVTPPERIVFTSCAFEDEQGVAQLEVLFTLTFQDMGSQTMLTLQGKVVRAAPHTMAALSMMESGWLESFDKLDETLATVH
mgnify:CR=1 FL=1